jgi:hypothetical protein
VGKRAGTILSDGINNIFFIFFVFFGGGASVLEIICENVYVGVEE